MGRGTTTIVDEAPRGGHHYDPKGSRRKVVFDNRKFHAPGSVVSMPTANPHTRNNPSRTTPNPHARNIPKSASPSPGRVLTPSPRVSLKPMGGGGGGGAKPAPRLPRSSGPTANPHTRNNPSPEEVAGMRSNPRNARAPAPVRSPGSSDWVKDRWHASEFTSAQRGNDRRLVREAGMKYSSANDPVGERMREAQRGLTGDILGNVFDILGYGIAGGSLVGGAGIARGVGSYLVTRRGAQTAATIKNNAAVVRRNQRQLKIPGGGGARPPIRKDPQKGRSRR